MMSISLLTIVIVLQVTFVYVVLARQYVNKPLLDGLPHQAATSHGFARGNMDNSSVCLSYDCIHTASLIKTKLKPSVNPCDDFYQFACGQFQETISIPKDQISISTITAIFESVQEELGNIVSEERPSTDPKHFHLPNKLYKACMNTNLIKRLDVEPLRKIVVSLGDWPVIKGDEWDLEQKWTWQKMNKEFQHLGFTTNHIFEFSMSQDMKNTTKWLIQLDQSATELSRELLLKGLNDTVVAAYYSYMVDLSVLFGGKRERALKELRASLQFEMDLANISLPAEKRRDFHELYNPFTVTQLQKRYPYMQWQDYINGLLPKGVEVGENELIIVAAPSFFDALGPLLARTPNRVIANYMMWRVHKFSARFLSERFRKRSLQFSKALTGIQKSEPRWKECVDFVSASLPVPVSSLYVRKYFDNESRALASEIVENVRSAFAATLDKVDWMDAHTKQKAKNKLSSMEAYIGYPDELMDNNKLAEFYDKLEIDEERYFHSFLNVSVFHTESSLNKLHLPTNATMWIETSNAIEVNAYYNPMGNSIHLPAAILRGHIFDKRRPKYMNYGAVGFAIGHELTHGFDDEGKQFDEKGNLVNWWQPDTEKSYLKRARCIIEQYGNYTDSKTGLKVNGVNTQGENIADNGAAKQSYRAYQKWVSQHGREVKLPGLDYTQEQLFWIAAAQIWCAKFRQEAYKNTFANDEHSPPQFRVLGAFSNTDEFAKDFNCPLGSTMNPKHKCEVW